jgi:predicted regulator of Ras-like GTPase activity (Roadblock/LC7/MglB family)
LLDEVYVRGENGYVVLRDVGQEAVLTVLARLFLDMRRASEDLAVIPGAQ